MSYPSSSVEIQEGKTEPATSKDNKSKDISCALNLYCSKAWQICIFFVPRATAKGSFLLYEEMAEQENY